ncbi:MAG: S8 family serine peptidase, partial [Halioglobus sp.]|nr:S8 family serine peptidase [Halioglobus sp.]
MVEHIVEIRLRLAKCWADYAPDAAAPAFDWEHFDYPLPGPLGEDGVRETFYNRFASTSCDACRDLVMAINDWILNQYNVVLMPNFLWGPTLGPGETQSQVAGRQMRARQDLANFEAGVRERMVKLRACEKERCSAQEDSAPGPFTGGFGALPGAGAQGGGAAPHDCTESGCKGLAELLKRKQGQYEKVGEEIERVRSRINDLDIDLRGSENSPEREVQGLKTERQGLQRDLEFLRERKDGLERQIDYLQRRLESCAVNCDDESGRGELAGKRPTGWKDSAYFPSDAAALVAGPGSPFGDFDIQGPIARDKAWFFANLNSDRASFKGAEWAKQRTSLQPLSVSAGDAGSAWGRAQVGLTDALLEQLGGSNPSPTLVAVIDSGVDIAHPDISAAVYDNDREYFNGRDDDGNGLVDDVTGWNYIDHNGASMDDNGHGTLVAGIIASRGSDDGSVAGINPWANILPLKVTDSTGEGGSVGLAVAITHAVNAGARVVNVSLGGAEYARAEQVAVDHAAEHDVLVVVAAGNTAADTGDFWPAGLDNVITVAASDESDASTAWSNFGSAVDIAAPGSNILSLRAAGMDPLALVDDDYEAGANVRGEQGHLYVTSGTSFAAPHVAGVASLLFSVNPRLTARQVRNMLLQSAVDIERPGVDPLSGYGRLDAAAALAADPDFYIEALITGVATARQDGALVVQV